MSWSISTEIKKDATTKSISDVVGILNSLDKTNIGNQQCVKERDEQVEIAINAAAHLIVNTGLAQNAEVIGVSLSGHANLNHEPVKDWANESITVSGYAKAYSLKA